MSQFALQRAFAGSRARSENFQNESGPVEHLDVPGALQIALLARPERAIDDDEFDAKFGKLALQFLDLAFAHQRRRARPRDRHDNRTDHIEGDGSGEAHGFVKAGFGRAGLASRPLGL